MFQKNKPGEPFGPAHQTLPFLLPLSRARPSPSSPRPPLPAIPTPLASQRACYPPTYIPVPLASPSEPFSFFFHPLTRGTRESASPPTAPRSPFLSSSPNHASARHGEDRRRASMRTLMPLPPSFSAPIKWPGPPPPISPTSRTSPRLQAAEISRRKPRRRRRPPPFPTNVSDPDPPRLIHLLRILLAHLLMPFFLTLVH